MDHHAEGFCPYEELKPNKFSLQDLDEQISTYVNSFFPSRLYESEGHIWLCFTA